MILDLDKIFLAAPWEDEEERLYLETRFKEEGLPIVLRIEDADTIIVEKDSDKDRLPSECRDKALSISFLEKLSSHLRNSRR